jgi:hypothetical protein
MSEEPKKEVTIVPVDATSIETSASIAGGVVGLLLAGPVGALVAAAIAKYSSKKDNEAGEALRGIGKSVVESYNFLNKLNAKYEISTKTGNAIKATLESSSADSETIDSIKGATTKIGDLNNEYDIVGKSKQVIAAAGTLSDATLEKIEELNEKYDFVGTSKKLATEAVEKAKESAASS